MTSCDCDGGWRWVARQYAEHSAAEALASYEHEGPPSSVLVAAFANSVYPCQECQPDLFFRWAGGHISSGHDPSRCSECSAANGKRRGREHPHPSPSGLEMSAPAPDDRDLDRWDSRRDLA